MKVSLAWLSEYCQSLATVSPGEIQSRFNQVTAEIEHFYAVEYPLEKLALAKIVTSDADAVSVSIPEWNISSQTLGQKTTKAVSVGEWHLVYKDGSTIRWATSEDLFADKTFELPAFACSAKEENGLWKQRVDATDIIFEVDNKSITNRPDLWGHYGLAREFGASFKFSVIPLPEASVKFTTHAKKATLAGSSVSIHNSAPEHCSIYGGVYLNKTERMPSDIAMAFRLIRVGGKPFQAIIDITNYVLYDLGQPMHAYDADSIEKEIHVRMAKDKEEVDLLSNVPVTLGAGDLVIADAKKVLCLAGVKGAIEGSMEHHTDAVILEAATFRAATIRRSAARHKLRTDSSARFEKTLDEERTIHALQRFLQLAHEQRIVTQKTFEGVLVGKMPEPTVISVSHDFLVRRSGVALIESDIITPLEAMEFNVALEKKGDEILYNITVPSFRASKDIKIPEDILEEVMRHYGYDRIPVALPPLIKQPTSLTPTLRLRALKQHLASAGQMMEQINYAYIDDAILQKLQWSFDNPVQMLNPVAENQKTLVQSLLPGLINQVTENMHAYDALRFFEVGRCIFQATDRLNEVKKLSGIFFHKRKEVDFYACKEVLEGLFTIAGLSVEWRQVQQKSAPWIRPYRTAELWANDVSLGYAGMMNQEMLFNMDGIEGSSAFCFELNLDLLMQEKLTSSCKPLSKYQGISFDLACMVPKGLTVDRLQALVLGVDSLIHRVEVFDFFEKKEWTDVRSIAIRVWMQSHEQTLTKEMIDGVRERILRVLAEENITLRV